MCLSFVGREDMRRLVCALLLIVAKVSTTVGSQRFLKKPQQDQCRPLTRSPPRDVTRCVEETTPVTRLTHLITQQLRWNNFVLISDTAADFEHTAKAFSAQHVSVGTVEASVAMSEAWMRSVAATGPSSRKHHINVVMACSSSCVRKVLQQADDFDVISRGRSVVWMTWSWLIVPRCGDESCDLVTWTVNTTMNNVAMLTPWLEVKSRGGYVHTLCPSVVSLTANHQGYIHLTYTGHFTTCAPPRYHGNQDIYPNKKRGFNGRKLTFVTKAWSYFVIAEEMNGQKTWRGPYIDLLDHLARRFNFTYSLVESPDNRWGSSNTTGHWDGVLGVVQRGEAVAVWVPYDVTHHRAVHFDFPSLTDLTAVTFIYRPPDTDHQLTLLLQPLSWQVLASVAASLPVVTMLLYLSETVTTRQSVHQTSTSQIISWERLHRCWRMVLGALFTEASPDDWRGGCSRLVVGSWWLVTVVLAAAYSGSLVAHLSYTRPYLPFRTLDDVVAQSEYKWGVFPNSSMHNIIKDSNVSLYRKFNEGLIRFIVSDPSVLATDSETHFHKVVHEKYVYMGPSYDLSLWQRRDCHLVTGRESLKQIMSTPVFAKDSAFTGYFSDVIEELRDNGLIETWNKHWIPKANCTPSQNPQTVISLGHLQGALYVAAGCVGLSVLVLVAERCFVSIVQRKICAQQV